MTRLTSEEIDALTQRISELGEGLALDQMLTALGQVVMQVLLQYPLDERSPATVSFIAVLAQQILADYKRNRAN